MKGLVLVYKGLELATVSLGAQPIRGGEVRLDWREALVVSHGRRAFNVLLAEVVPAAFVRGLADSGMEVIVGDMRMGLILCLRLPEGAESIPVNSLVDTGVAAIGKVQLSKGSVDFLGHRNPGIVGSLLKKIVTTAYWMGAATPSAV